MSDTESVGNAVLQIEKQLQGIHNNESLEKR